MNSLWRKNGNLNFNEKLIYLGFLYRIIFQLTDAEDSRRWEKKEKKWQDYLFIW